MFHQFLSFCRRYLHEEQAHDKTDGWLDTTFLDDETQDVIHPLFDTDFENLRQRYLLKDTDDDNQHDIENNLEDSMAAVDKTKASHQSASANTAGVKPTVDTSIFHNLTFNKPNNSSTSQQDAYAQLEDYKAQLQANKAQLKLLKLREKTINLLYKKQKSEYDLLIHNPSATESDMVLVDIAMYQAIVEFDVTHQIANISPQSTQYIEKRLAECQQEYAKLLAEASSTKQSKQANNTAKSTSSSSSSNSPSSIPTQDQTSIEDYFSDFIGLNSVQDEVKKIIAFLQVQKMRQQQGTPIKNPPSRHMVFTGNPGTGKTEMARLIAKIMYDTGIVAQDIFIEADRADLIAEYLGQTAIKTKALIEQSFGGVLFIDEAYTLKTREDDMYGDEAIATLLKMMEDHRDKVTIIVAGYEEEMASFIETNPGLKSRFNRHIHFPDYEDEVLYEILLKMISINHYKLASPQEVKPIALSYLTTQRIQQGDTFANARAVRNYFEKVIEQQSLRVVSQAHADLNLLAPTDFYI